MGDGSRPTVRLDARPARVRPADAGAARLGGWIAPGGEFYEAPWLQHLQVAAKLRASGSGPRDPWDMRDTWVMVKTSGEVVSLPDLTQPQWDTLGDLLQAAPPGSYRTNMIASLRQLHELEVHVHG